MMGAKQSIPGESMVFYNEPQIRVNFDYLFEKVLWVELKILNLYH